MKRCTGCGEMKPITEFHRDHDRRKPRCATCTGTYMRAWRKANPHLKSAQNRRYRTVHPTRSANHHIALADRKALYEAQRGIDPICGASIPEDKMYLDHDHRCCPGKRSCGECLRGLLCHYCNVRLVPAAEMMRALGYALDPRIIAYLDDYVLFVEGTA